MNSFEYGFFDELEKLAAENSKNTVFVTNPADNSRYARLRRQALERDRDIKHVEDNSFYGRYRRRASARDKNQDKPIEEARRPDWATKDED